MSDEVVLQNHLDHVNPETFETGIVNVHQFLCGSRSEATVIYRYILFMKLSTVPWSICST